MSSINSLLESTANEYKASQAEAAGLANKWNKTGLLKGLDTEVSRNNMAMILENQTKQLLTEQSSTNQGGGTFTVGKGEQWAGIALPMVRKVFGKISSKEFVSVQPMKMPSGLVFFLDFQYGQGKTPFTAGGDIYGSGSLYGVVGAAGSSPSKGLFGAGRFAYSINQFSASVGTTVATASWADLDYAQDLSSSFASYSKVTINNSGMTRPDNAGVRSFVLASGSTATTGTVNALLPQYTSTNGTTTSFIYLGAVGAANIPTNGTTSSVFYSQQPVDNNRGDFEDVAGGGRPNANSISADALAIPEINIDMKSESLVAKTRKLKAKWTPEFAQDYNAYQAGDAEAELTNIMSEYISLEIDLEVLDMLMQDASASDEYWSAQNNQSLNSAKTGFDNLGFYNTQGGWFQTLGTKMQKVSNLIHQKTFRGGANFLVCSPTVATILESIPGFSSNSDGDVTSATYAFGIQKAGQINNRYTVYKNPYMTENVILMGYRGSQFLETGAVFAPYVPLIMTPLVYDPETFTPRKGLLTRYAKKMIRSEFYGRIFVSGLSSI
jgi:hypothetical protein